MAKHMVPGTSILGSWNSHFIGFSSVNHQFCEFSGNGGSCNDVNGLGNIPGGLMMVFMIINDG